MKDLQVWLRKPKAVGSGMAAGAPKATVKSKWRLGEKQKFT